jgi:DNA-binding transcriptional LysR family regulator
VLLGPQCVFRREATAKLEAAGIPWRVAATSPSLAGLWASALGGLGLTVRSRLALPETLAADGRMFELPALRSFPVTLHVRPGAAGAIVDRLQAIVGEVTAMTLPHPTRTLRRTRATP